MDTKTEFVKRGYRDDDDLRAIADLCNLVDTHDKLVCCLCKKRKMSRKT